MRIPRFNDKSKERKMKDHKVQTSRYGKASLFMILPLLFLVFLGASTVSDAPNLEQKQKYVTDEMIEPEISGQGSETLENYPKLEVTSFVSDDGRKGWKAKVQNPLPLASPAVVDGKLYIGGGFGSYEFYAFDAETGKPLWLFHCGDDGPTAAVVEKGRVAFNTESCILYVLDAKTGRKLWGKWLGDPLMSQPAMKDDRVVMAYPNQKGGHSIACMNAQTGDEYWVDDIPGEIISAPIIADDKVYASTLEGSVHCFNLANGEKLFSKKHQATSAPWVWKGEIYVSLREDEKQIQAGKEIVVRSEGQGRINTAGERANKDLWVKQHADYLITDNSSEYAAAQKSLDASVGFGSAPAAAKLEQGEANLGVASVSGIWAYQGSRPSIIMDRSYSSMGDTLKSLDPATGKLLWQKYIKIKDSPGGRPFSPPSYANGKLYIGAVSGEIICLDARDGKELWRYNCGEPVRFQPVIAKGKVYWGTDNGSVFCIDARDPDADGWLMWGGNAQHNI